jgi:hypothetical protein
MMGVALVLGLLSAPDARAQSAKKIIVLGGDKSTVISGIAKTRTRLNAKQMMTSAKERKEKLKTAEEERAETKKRLKAQLADVDVVAADLSVPSTGEDDGLMVQAALEAGVPVVLENSDSAKMAELTGALGVNATTAVIETTEGGGQFAITIVDGPELIAQSGPEQAVELTTKPVPEDPAAKAALTAYEAEQQAARAKEPKPSSKPQVAKPTSAQKTASVEAIINEKALKRGVRRQAYLTGQCGDGVKCREGEIKMAAPLQFCPGGVCSSNSSLAPVLEWGVYKTVGQDPMTGQSRTTAYVVVRAAGRPNIAMTSNAMQNRGYYLESWNIKFAATYPNSSWSLDKAAPENANQQVSVAYNTGFTLGATATNPPSVSFGYAASATRTMNTEQFGITRTTTDTTTVDTVSWFTKMQMDAYDGPPRAYSTPSSLFIQWFLSTTDVAPLPAIAMYGSDFRAEATWDGNRDASCGTCTIRIDGNFKLQLQRAWSNREFAYRTYVWKTYTQPFAVETNLTLQAATHW